MTIKLFFLSLFMGICATCCCQEKNKTRFTNITQVGSLSGESSTEFQVQTINGISWKTMLVGLGCGLDYYYHTTIPVFIDLRKQIFNKTGAFVFADVGHSIAIKTSLEEFEMDRKGGLYYALGLGYEIAINKKVSAVFDLGYSYKRLSKIIDNEPWRSSLHEFATYDYCLNRISVKAGLRF